MVYCERSTGQDRQDRQNAGRVRSSLGHTETRGTHNMTSTTDPFGIKREKERKEKGERKTAEGADEKMPPSQRLLSTFSTTFNTFFRGSSPFSLFLFLLTQPLPFVPSFLCLLRWASRLPSSCNRSHGAPHPFFDKPGGQIPFETIATPT